MVAQKRSCYGVIICKEKPGCLYLVYQHADGKSHHEDITIVPDGFSFRKLTYKSLDHLFNGFKKIELKRVAEMAKARPPSRPPPQGYAGPPNNLPPRAAPAIPPSYPPRPTIPPILPPHLHGRPSGLPYPPQHGGRPTYTR